MRYQNVVARLERRLAEPLPGAAAHARLAPRPRRQWPPGFDPAAVRHAAGLLVVFPVGDRAHIVLTKRAGTLGRHGGQVALPGGAVDPGETFEAAAVREAHEEVGLPHEAVRLLGRLTPLDIPVSGFRLHPVVAAVEVRPLLVPSAAEVDAILEVPIAALLGPDCVTTTRRERDGRAVMVPAFQVGGHEIWGATAMVVAEFLSLLDRPPQ